MVEYIKKCKNENCGILFKTDTPIIDYCSEKCRKDNQYTTLKQKSIERYKNIPDIPTCKICGFKAINLIHHIVEFHNMSQKTYMRKYKAKLKDIYHHSYTDEVKIRGVGFISHCKRCGKEFEKITPKRNYCSKECQREAHLQKKRDYEHRIDRTPTRGTDRECRQCKKIYTPKKNAIHSYFCSPKCRNHYYYELKKKNGIKHCKHCNKEFSQTEKGLFCSRNCRLKYRKNKKEIELQKRVKDSIEKYKDISDIPTCKICGLKAQLLSNHITLTHKMEIETYCKKYKVNKKSLIWIKIKKIMKEKRTKLFYSKVKEYMERERHTSNSSQ